LTGTSKPLTRRFRFVQGPVGCTTKLKRRLRPTCGLTTDAGARTVIAGHAFVQNLRRGHYELTADVPSKLRVSTAFDELAHAV